MWTWSWIDNENTNSSYTVLICICHTNNMHMFMIWTYKTDLNIVGSDIMCQTNTRAFTYFWYITPIWSGYSMVHVKYRLNLSKSMTCKCSWKGKKGQKVHTSYNNIFHIISPSFFNKNYWIYLKHFNIWINIDSDYYTEMYIKSNHDILNMYNCLKEWLKRPCYIGVR